MKSNTPIHVLLVEDDPAEAKTIALLLVRSGLHHELTIVQNAKSAIAFLNHSHPFEIAPVPNLVILGLQLPLIGGVAVLAEIRQQRAARHAITGVIVLSKSENAASRNAARILGADGYVVKPISPEDLESTALELREVWERLVGRGATAS